MVVVVVVAVVRFLPPLLLPLLMAGMDHAVEAIVAVAVAMAAEAANRSISYPGRIVGYSTRPRLSPEETPLLLGPLLGLLLTTLLILIRLRRHGTNTNTMVQGPGHGRGLGRLLRSTWMGCLITIRLRDGLRDSTDRRMGIIDDEVDLGWPAGWLARDVVVR